MSASIKSKPGGGGSIAADGTDRVNIASDGSVTIPTLKSRKSTVRVVTANGYGSTNTVIRRYSTIADNEGTDITYADSATLGASFTINTEGTYAISMTDRYSAAGAVGISKNSSQLSTNINTINALDRLANIDTATANFGATASTTVYLTAGSIIRPHTDGVGTGSLNLGSFTITRVD